jgi:hypothetical protein
MVHCSATTPPSASRYTLRLWRQLGLPLRRGPWSAPRRRNAEACSSRRPRAGNSSWCVMPGRDAHLPTWRRSVAASRRQVEPRRTRHRRRCRSLEPRAFALQPPAPGFAAVQPARIANLGVPTPPREGVNAATPTTDTRGEGCPGSTSGSGLYQQLYLRAAPPGCLNPTR